MSVRHEVVDLLMDLDPALSDPEDSRYVRRDGQPFTEAETALVRSATTEDLDAARDLHDAIVRALREDQAAAMTDFARLCVIAAPYWATHGLAVPLRELAAFMGETERAELTAILDRAGPVEP